jgi:hypothetical protein
MELLTPSFTITLNQQQFTVTHNTSSRSDFISPCLVTGIINGYSSAKFSLSVSWQRMYNTGTKNVSLNHALPISLHYSAHNIFKSHVNLPKMISCTLLYSCSSSSVLLQLTACLLASAAYYSHLQLRNFAHLMQTHHGHASQKNTCNVTATHCCGDVIAPAHAARTQRKHCRCTVGRVCVAGVA